LRGEGGREKTTGPACGGVRVRRMQAHLVRGKQKENRGRGEEKSEEQESDLNDRQDMKEKRQCRT